MSERTAVYPGSFDPPTYGHLDLIQRARRMFDRVVVGVAPNTAKQFLFTADERVEMLTELTDGMDNVTVTRFDGLTVDFAADHDACALIRGLRAVSDFEYELMMAMTNRKLQPGIDTVCLMPSENQLFLSSRVAKEIARFGGDIGSFVPDSVATRLFAKFPGGQA